MSENIVPFVLIAFAYHHCKQREIFVGVGAIIVSFITLSRLVMGERNIHTNYLENVYEILYTVRPFVKSQNHQNWLWRQK